MASCPLCRQRKGKRACPAKGEAICSHCCGTKRRVDIDCPPDCVFLTGGHATAWEGRETERRRDVIRVFPRLEPLSDAQRQLFFLALVGLQGVRARRRELDDLLLAQALRALHKTVETRTRGVLYEHAPEDMRAQGLVLELRGLFEAKDEDGQVSSPDDADLLPVLAALDKALADTVEEDAGPTSFLDTVTRLVGRLSAEAGPRARPLIVEP